MAQKMPDPFGGSGKPLSEEKCNGTNHRNDSLALCVPTIGSVCSAGKKRASGRKSAVSTHHESASTATMRKNGTRNGS